MTKFNGFEIFEMLQMTTLQVQSKKRRLMRSAVSETSKLMADADLISQPVYVLDADDEYQGDKFCNFCKNQFSHIDFTGVNFTKNNNNSYQTIIILRVSSPLLFFTILIISLPTVLVYSITS